MLHWGPAGHTRPEVEIKGMEFEIVHALSCKILEIFVLNPGDGRLILDVDKPQKGELSRSMKRRVKHFREGERERGG